MDSAAYTCNGQDLQHAYHAFCGRHYQTGITHLLHEYLNICARHSDDALARALHQRFVASVDAMRLLLLRQREVGADKGDDWRGAGGIGGGAWDPAQAGSSDDVSSTPARRARVVIIKDDMSKDYTDRMRRAWAGSMDDVIADATEAAVAWLIDNAEYAHYSDLHLSGTASCYASHIGITMQRWPNSKAAKDYVSALHAVVNAPLSPFMTPLAFTLQILGVTFVCASVAPVESLLVDWRQFPLIGHGLNAVCASLRFIRTSFPVSAGTHDVVGPTGRPPAVDLAEHYTQFPPETYPELACSQGFDGFLYVLDARSIPLRGAQDVPSYPQPNVSVPTFFRTPNAQRFPRRECLFSLQGCPATPYAPEPFVGRFKVPSVADYLIENRDEVTKRAATLSYLLHKQGITYGPHIYPLYATLADRERQLTASLRATNRRKAEIEKVQGRIAQVSAAKAVVFTDVIARVIKRVVCEEWRRVCAAPTFLNRMKQAAEGSTESDETLRALNGRLVDAAAAVLRGVFAPAARSVLDDDPDAPPGLPVVHPNMFEELVIIANDAFVKRMIPPEAHEMCHYAFDKNPADLVVSHLIRLLERLLCVTLRPSRRGLEIDPARTDLFKHFFELARSDKCPLRSSASVVAVEVPLALVTGSKTRTKEWGGLQVRVCDKLASSIDTAWAPTMMAYVVSVVRYLRLNADDIAVACRGYLTDGDYDGTRFSTSVESSLPPESLLDLVAVEVLVSQRRAWLSALQDPHACIRQLAHYSERTQRLTEANAPITTSVYSLVKLRLLARLCERFGGANAIGALEVVLKDLDTLATDFGHIAGKSARVTVGGKTYKETRILRIGQHLLPALSSLVRHSVNPPAGARDRSMLLVKAVRVSEVRRDIIAMLYGPDSLETGIACNEVAMICANHLLDYDHAEEEYERSVLVLSTAQPQGPAIFITMNNLASLYFKRAETIKRQPAAGAERQLREERVKLNLDKAGALLDKVLAVRDKLAVTDLCSAINNLGSVKSLLGSAREAKALFNETIRIADKTPKTVADLSNCRTHAQESLKVFERQEYVATILRIQMALRRFVRNVRRNKYVRMQRVARAYQQRRNLALLYRFSAYHFWMRQPKHFLRKLPIGARELLAPEQRAMWQAKVADAVKRLQPLLRAANMRSILGRRVYVHQQYFSACRPAIEHEINLRRAQAFAGFVMEDKQLMMAAIVEQLNAELRMPCIAASAALHQDATRRAEQQRRLMIQTQQEASQRTVLVAEEVQGYRVFFLQSKLNDTILQEQRLRIGILSEGLFIQNALFQQSVVRGWERLWRSRLRFWPAALKIQAQETQMRAALLHEARVAHAALFVRVHEALTTAALGDIQREERRAFEMINTTTTRRPEDDTVLMAVEADMSTLRCMLSDLQTTLQSEALPAADTVVLGRYLSGPVVALRDWHSSYAVRRRTLAEHICAEMPTIAAAVARAINPHVDSAVAMLQGELTVEEFRAELDRSLGPPPPPLGQVEAVRDLLVTLRLLKNYAKRRQAVQKEITARERALAEVMAVAAANEGGGLHDVEAAVAIHRLLLEVQRASVGVVEGVRAWREGLCAPHPFVVGSGENYLLKMFRDGRMLAEHPAVAKALPMQGLCARYPLFSNVPTIGRYTVEREARGGVYQPLGAPPVDVRHQRRIEAAEAYMHREVERQLDMLRALLELAQRGEFLPVIDISRVCPVLAAQCESDSDESDDEPAASAPDGHVSALASLQKPKRRSGCDGVVFERGLMLGSQAWQREVERSLLGGLNRLRAQAAAAPPPSSQQQQQRGGRDLRRFEGSGSPTASPPDSAKTQRHFALLALSRPAGEGDDDGRRGDHRHGNDRVDHKGNASSKSPSTGVTSSSRSTRDAFALPPIGPTATATPISHPTTPRTPATTRHAPQPNGRRH